MPVLEALALLVVAALTWRGGAALYKLHMERRKERRSLESSDRVKQLAAELMLDREMGRTVLNELQGQLGEPADGPSLRAEHRPLVVVIAVKDGELVLTQRARPALDRTCIELPSGYGAGKEVLEETSVRLLKEQTGLTAADARWLFTSPILPDLTGQEVCFCLATNVTGQAGQEVRAVRLERARDFLASQAGAVDAKVYIGLHFAQEQRRATAATGASAPPP